MRATTDEAVDLWAEPTTRPMLPVSLRRYETADLLPVLRVQEPAPGQWTAQQFVEATSGRRHGAGLVAEHRGRVVGFLVYRARAAQFVGGDPVGTGRVELLHLGVEPGLRRRGVAALLVAAAAGQARGAGELPLCAAVREHNDAGVRFFAALGFRAEPRRAYFPDGEDAIFFRYEYGGGGR